MKIACVGEAMIELSLGEGRQAMVGFAGDTLNTAIYLKRAAPEFGVSYITRLGRDDFSARLREFIAEESILIDGIETSETRQVGLYAITTDAGGERSFTYWRSHSAAREMFQGAGGFDFEGLAGFDVVYLSAITLAILPEEVREALADWLNGFRARGGQVAFDSNYRPALWDDQAEAQRWIARFWGLSDLSLPSVDDEMAIFGDADEASVLARLQGFGVRDGALKRGPEGPLSLGAVVDARYEPAENVVDTTAAGDSFNAGYLAARLSGVQQAAALQAGHDLAAYVVGVKGAIAPRG